MDLDLIIENGFIIDGSGSPGRSGRIGIKAGRVVLLDETTAVTAAEVVDAEGRVVAPGFIDPHTHVDPQLWWDPFGLPLVLHGVTTVMTGSCGISLAPCNQGDSDALASLFYQVEEVPLSTLKSAVPWAWRTFGEYLAGLRGRLGINCAALVGHNAVRFAVMGKESLERTATPDEIDDMRRIVRDSLRGGAIGFSTSQNKLHVAEGGIPIPSRWADTEEIVALCNVVGEEKRGIIQTDGGVDIAHRAQWVEEIGGPLAERSGRTVLAGNVLPRFAASQTILDVIGTFQDRGASIYAQAAPSRFDSYFTLDGGTVTFNVYPSWTRIASMSHSERLAAFRDPTMREDLHRESVEAKGAIPWRRIRICKTGPQHQHLVGQSVVDYAAARQARIIDAVADLALEEDLQTQFVIEANPEADDMIADFLQSPQAIVGGSDAGAHVKTFCGGGNTSLLLAKWVKERGILSLPEAVRRITSEPALVLGLADRGLLANGSAADVVVFDPERVSYDQPRMVADLPGGEERLWHDASGFDHVIVNGRFAVRDGQVTETLAGELVTSG